MALTPERKERMFATIDKMQADLDELAGKAIPYTGPADVAIAVGEALSTVMAVAHVLGEIVREVVADS